MNISTDEGHRESLALMQEIHDYLMRLPPVPITLEFCAKIRKHLDNPTHKLMLDYQTERRGEIMSPSGVVQLEAILRGDTLTLNIPQLAPHLRKDLNGSSLILSRS